MKTHQLDGSPKYVTTDCATCCFYIEPPASRLITQRHPFPKKYGPAPAQLVRWCIWGIAIKRVVPRAKPRACVLRHKTAQGATKWMTYLAEPAHTPVTDTLPGFEETHP